MTTAKKKFFTLGQCLAPLPQTKRGYGFVASTVSTSDGEWLAYCSGRYVFIRGLHDSSQCSVFAGSKDKVNVAAFSPNGEYVACAGESGEIIIFERSNLREKMKSPGPRDCYDICWGPDGKRVVACGVGQGPMNTVCFSFETGASIGRAGGHIKPVLSCSYRPTRPYSILTCGEDMTVQFSTGPPFAATKTHRQHENYVNCVKFSPDGELAVSVGSDKKIIVYEGKTGDVVKEIVDKKNGHKGSIYSLSWSPCSKFILTSSADKSAKIWNVEEGTVTQTFQFENSTTNMQMGNVWHKGGDGQEYLISFSLHGNLNFLNAESGEITKTLSGISTPPTAFSAVPSSDDFFLGTFGGVIARYSSDTDWTIVSGKGHGTNIRSISCSSNGEFVYSVASDSQFRTTETKTMEYAGALDLGGLPTCVSASKTDPLLCAISLESKRILIMKDGSILSTTDVKYIPSCLEWGPGDECLAVGSTEKGKKGKIYMFDFDGTEIKQSSVYDHTFSQPPNKIQFSGKYVSANSSKQIIVFEEGKVRNSSYWEIHGGSTKSHAWNPSSTLVSSVATDENIIVWRDMKRFMLTRKTKKVAHIGGGFFTHWLNDTTFLTVGASGAVKIWTVPVVE